MTGMRAMINNGLYYAIAFSFIWAENKAYNFTQCYNHQLCLVEVKTPISYVTSPLSILNRLEPFVSQLDASVNFREPWKVLDCQIQIFRKFKNSTYLAFKIFFNLLKFICML